MHLILGLGNPGQKYIKTRHNLGFRIIDELALRLKISRYKSRCRSDLAEAKIKSHKVVLIKPQTYMNNSGEVLFELFSWYKTGPQHLIIIYDDVDLPVGKIRIRQSGSAGGHHGVESIIKYAKTSSFTRVRVGIGKRLGEETSNYVLNKFSKEDLVIIEPAIIKAADIVCEIVAAGIGPAN
ncbi:aminoacyl-tRNA hydrolase [Candidatus Margulisiibacteriota bacterium]